MAAPERTCVGCRAKAEKPGLIRFVRVEGGSVAMDARATLPGRGAYVHRDPGCVELALGRGVLARALRSGLDADGAARLRVDIEGELHG